MKGKAKKEGHPTPDAEIKATLKVVKSAPATSRDKQPANTASKSSIDNFTSPPQQLVRTLTQPLNSYFTPEFLGMEKVQANRPALYIANHTIYGITDWTLWMAEVYLKKNIFIRTLSDNMHYTVPGWRELVQYFGMVRGTRDNCSRLMQQGKHIMVFPGGGREVFRKKHEKYSLQWKKRTGFALMAIQHGYDIVPVAQVGGDDAYDIVADANDILGSFFGRALKVTGIHNRLKESEYLPPLSLGLFGTALPKPVKLYFSVGNRITTSQYKGDTSEEILWKVRNEAELEMSREILRLLEYRKKDKNVSGLRKWLAGV